MQRTFNSFLANFKSYCYTLGNIYHKALWAGAYRSRIWGQHFAALFFFELFGFMEQSLILAGTSDWAQSLAADVMYSCNHNDSTPTAN